LTRSMVKYSEEAQNSSWQRGGGRRTGAPPKNCERGGKAAKHQTAGVQISSATGKDSRGERGTKESKTPEDEEGHRGVTDK